MIERTPLKSSRTLSSSRPCVSEMTPMSLGFALISSVNFGGYRVHRINYEDSYGWIEEKVWPHVMAEEEGHVVEDNIVHVLAHEVTGYHACDKGYDET